MFTSDSSHLGNSVIVFYGSASHLKSDIAVRVIKWIVQNQQTSLLIVQRYKPCDGDTLDPFSLYKDFPGQLYLTKMHAPEIIELNQVKCHAARFVIPGREHVVAVMLSRF